MFITGYLPLMNFHFLGGSVSAGNQTSKPIHHWFGNPSPLTVQTFTSLLAFMLCKTLVI